MNKKGLIYGGRGFGRTAPPPPPRGAHAAMLKAWFRETEAVEVDDEAAAYKALLDGLVAQRRAQGLPATGINFGPWAQGGMASSEAAVANISAQGLIPLEPSAALSAMAEVVANGTGQATVLKANWQRAAKVLGSARPPILALVLPSTAGEAKFSEAMSWRVVFCRSSSSAT